jgi:hypothetical protein
MDQTRSSPASELEERFRELTLLMYDTSVAIPLLEERVYPYLAPDIAFVDPWVMIHGGGTFRNGLRGFHCVIRFDFEIFQLGVQMNAAGDGGRALVDGVMNLRQLRFYTYPLRTILVYDFVLTEGGGLQITRLEEMWSFGDMIQNVPLVGRFYDGVYRPGFGYLFTGMFWLACALFGPGGLRTRTRPPPRSRP